MEPRDVSREGDSHPKIEQSCVLGERASQRPDTEVAQAETLHDTSLASNDDQLGAAEDAEVRFDERVRAATLGSALRRTPLEESNWPKPGDSVVIQRGDVKGLEAETAHRADILAGPGDVMTL